MLVVVLDHQALRRAPKHQIKRLTKIMIKTNNQKEIIIRSNLKRARIVQIPILSHPLRANLRQRIRKRMIINQ